MIVLLASAKTLDFTTPWRAPSTTTPERLDRAIALMARLRSLSAKQIAALMGVSPKIAQLNAERFQQFAAAHTKQNAKPALLAYQGQVYRSMRAAQFTDDDLTFAHRTLRIVSGLYGVVRPLDLIQPYRLEMAIKLGGPGWKDLYDYWSESVTELVDHDSRANGQLIINLASQEYFRALRTDRLSSRVLAITFKQWRNGRSDMVPILAKRARGLMAGFIVRERVVEPERLRAFRDEGYRFMADESDDGEWVFLRRTAKA